MITYYAIREKQTKRYISGTDFNDMSAIPISPVLPPLLLAGFELRTQLVRRQIDRTRYEIVPICFGNGILVSGSPYEGFPPELEADV